MASTASDFVTVKQLGQGCSGICRLVRRRADNRLYALKELEMPADPAESSAVLQEVHILASLEHPFIVRYFDSFVEMRTLFLVMEYAPNGSLHTVLTEHQRTARQIAEDTIWRYMLQLLLGLHTIHTRRVVHRDIKPHNIFLGADDTVKIGDFGVSRMLSGACPARVPPTRPHARTSPSLPTPRSLPTPPARIRRPLMRNTQLPTCAIHLLLRGRLG